MKQSFRKDTPSPSPITSPANFHPPFCKRSHLLQTGSRLHPLVVDPAIFFFFFLKLHPVDLVQVSSFVHLSRPKLAPTPHSKIPRLHGGTRIGTQVFENQVLCSWGQGQVSYLETLGTCLASFGFERQVDRIGVEACSLSRTLAHAGGP